MLLAKQVTLYLPSFIFPLFFFMSSVAQSQAEIVTEGLFLHYPVLKEIYDRYSFGKLFYPIYIGHEDSLFMSSVACYSRTNWDISDKLW